MSSKKDELAEESAEEAVAFDEEAGGAVQEQAPEISDKEDSLDNPVQKRWRVGYLVFLTLAVIGGIVAGAVVGTRNRKEDAESSTTTLSGTIVDIHNETIFPGTIVVRDSRIAKIRPAEESAVEPGRFVIPGFVDSHVHIEWSLLVPSEFARLSVIHGTIATVSDPHEIANVLG